MTPPPNLKVNIRNPQVSGDQEPMIVSWGKFYGLKEQTGGGFLF